jgi:hypothetical protein
MTWFDYRPCRLGCVAETVSEPVLCTLKWPRSSLPPRLAMSKWRPKVPRRVRSKAQLQFSCSLSFSLDSSLLASRLGILIPTDFHVYAFSLQSWVEVNASKIRLPGSSSRSSPPASASPSRRWRPSAMFARGSPARAGGGPVCLQRAAFPGIPCDGMPSSIRRARYGKNGFEETRSSESRSTMSTRRSPLGAIAPSLIPKSSAESGVTP